MKDNDKYLLKCNEYLDVLLHNKEELNFIQNNEKEEIKFLKNSIIKETNIIEIKQHYDDFIVNDDTIIQKQELTINYLKEIKEKEILKISNEKNIIEQK